MLMKRIMKKAKVNSKQNQSEWQDKKITLMGLGLLGRGIGDALFFAKQGAHVIVTDLKDKKALKTSIDQLQKKAGASFKRITFVLGEHRLEDFEDKDMIVKAAGVPLDSPYIAHARAKGIPIRMSTALFAKRAQAKGVRIIGITGTRGKTTVTHLLFHILKKLVVRGRVFIGGNVRGMSTIALLPKVKKGDTVVLELDSWQLQGFGEEKFSPDVSVFTTFMHDHLNYYKNDLERYFGDKAFIFQFQKKGDITVFGPVIGEFIKKFNLKTPVAPLIAEPFKEPVSDYLPGSHNALNAALAYETAHALGYSTIKIKSAIKTFKGVAGRLQKIAVKNGVTFYNDTTATTPHAAAAGLQALAKLFPQARIIPVIGGADKQIDMEPLIKALHTYAHATIVLPGTGTDRIASDLDALSKEKNIYKIGPEKTSQLIIKKALAAALSYACKGDVIVLSPGFASFGYFKNEYDRGDIWDIAVKQIKTKNKYSI